MSRKPQRVRTSLLAVAALSIGGWIGVVSANTERRPGDFMTGPPDCSAEELVVELAEADLLAAELVEGYAQLDLDVCNAGAGPCTVEELILALAQADVAAAEISLSDAEADLAACEQGGCSKILEPLVDETTLLDPIQIIIDDLDSGPSPVRQSE